MKKSIKNAVLVGLGLAVGCAAATVRPTSVSVATAQARAGEWRCYAVTKFPDPHDAADNADSRKMTRGLNNVAQGTAAGTIVVVGTVVCVKS